MRHVVIVVPDWIRENSSEDVLRQSLPTLARIAEFGCVFKVSQVPAAECPEAFVLGVGPGVAQLRQGPLTISALNADPPDRSVHFHLSLMEFEDGGVKCSSLEPTLEDLRTILGVVTKLNTPTLTFVAGESRDHGLVWEGMGDLHTSTPAEVEGQSMRGRLPDGDGDPILRRYIDDSINLLSELELNSKRADEDLPKLNLLWPWGNGVRLPVPNLALKRGAPSLVISDSMRLQGLTRLAGYRHVDRHDFRTGLQFDLKRTAERVLTTDSSIVYLQTIGKLQADQWLEERSWFTRQIDEVLLEPILEAITGDPMRLTLLAPSVDSMGLGIEIETNNFGSGSTPFDCRSLDEKALPVKTMWEPIAANLSS